MNLLGIVNSTSSPSNEPQWKSPRPPDRVLIASNGSTSIVLDYIGPAIEYWRDTSGFDEEFVNLPAGILVVEADITSWHEQTVNGDDYDSELDFLEVRSATDEEVKSYVSIESAWDRALWVKETSEE